MLRSSSLLVCSAENAKSCFCSSALNRLIHRRLLWSGVEHVAAATTQATAVREEAQAHVATLPSFRTGYALRHKSKESLE